MNDSINCGEDIFQAEKLLGELILELASGHRMAKILQNQGRVFEEDPLLRRHYLLLITITLSKLLEFFSRFGTTVPPELLPASRNLVKELERRRIPVFRNGFLGKIWNRRKQEPILGQIVDNVLEEIIQNNESDFLEWIGGSEKNPLPDSVAGILRQIRDGIRKRYGLDGQGHLDLMQS